MIYFVIKNDPVSGEHRPFQVEIQNIEVKDSPAPRIEPKPVPPLEIPRRRPLPPILEPPIESIHGKLLCLSMMDAEYQNMLAALVPKIAIQEKLEVEKIESLFNDAGATKFYQEIADEFAIACNYAANVVHIKGDK
jgi:hypothetical protein